MELGLARQRRLQEGFGQDLSPEEQTTFIKLKGKDNGAGKE